jgi:excisionase family DNA binding protein
MNAEPLVTKKEAAKHTSLTPRSIENWMNRGLPHYKLGKRRTRFKLSEVDAFFAMRCGVNRPVAS